MKMKIKINKYRKSVYLLEISMLYLIFCQIAYAQTSRIFSRTARVGEIVLLSILFLLSLTKSKSKNFNIGIIFGLLVYTNLVACLLTYGNLMIFIEGTYDYLKYFSLMLYAIKSEFTEDEINRLLKTLSIVVLISTFFGMLQFSGNRWAFEMFRGRFGIYAREGYYRAIGIFAYPIEFGNFSCVLFALFYGFNKKLKSKYYYLICGLLLVDTLISGSRVPFVCTVVIIIISNMNRMKNRLRAIGILIVVALLATNFIDLDSTQARLKLYLYGETPRTYFIEKGLEVWIDNPIFGIGFETYGTQKFRDDTNDLIYNKYNIHDWDWANLESTDVFYAQILPEFGLIGCIAFVLFILLLIKKWKLKKRYEDYSALLIYAPVSCVLLCVNSSSAPFSPHVGSFVWLSMGLIISRRSSYITDKGGEYEK